MKTFFITLGGIIAGCLLGVVYCIVYYIYHDKTE